MKILAAKKAVASSLHHQLVHQFERQGGHSRHRRRQSHPERADCHGKRGPDTETDRAISDAVAAIRKYAAEHGRTHGLHLGPGQPNDGQAAQRHRHHGLLQAQLGQHRRLPRQVPGRRLLQSITLLLQRRLQRSRVGGDEREPAPCLRVAEKGQRRAVSWPGSAAGCAAA